MPEMQPVVTPAGFPQPYDYYLGLLGKWPTGIALASQWLVVIDFSPVKGLLTNLESIITQKESGWKYDSGLSTFLIDSSLQSNVDQRNGCTFARQISLPGESIEASNQGLDYGGYLAPATASKRSNYEPLSLTLLETNASFLDLIIRPWIILVGYYGLVARASGSQKNVKANIDLYMFAKSGPTKPTDIRKHYKFYNAAPISLGGETYSYTEEGLRYSDVKFIYDKYTVDDGNSRNYYNS